MATITDSRIIPQSYRAVYSDENMQTYQPIEDTHGFIVLLFKSRARKPHAHIRFSTAEKRAEYVAEMANRYRVHEMKKADARKARQNFQHGYVVGDILCGSWGYEQTNWSFYQVTAVNGKTITIREISTSHESLSVPDQYMATPNRDDFLDSEKELVKRPTKSWRENGKGYVKINSFIGVDQWDGRPKHGTSYY